MGSLPRLTANIGEQIASSDKNEFSSIIQNIKKIKEKEEPYIVFLVFDLTKDQINIEVDKKFNQDSVSDYFYFGNNSAAASQYYLTREGSSIKYLLLSAYSDLFNVLKNNAMDKGELGKVINTLKECNMMTLSDRKGEGRLNLSKLSIVSNRQIDKIKIDKKGNIETDEKKISADSFIRFFIKDANKANKFVLAVPKVILKDGKEIILPKHEDYLKVVKIENRLDESVINEQGKEKVCYVCKKSKPNVTSEYSTKFDRTGINKIFTTTTINSSPFLSDFNYDQNYSICNQCYQKLKSGEKAVTAQFKSKIAGEDAFIIPEAMMSDLNYKYLNYLKKSVDLAFNSKDASAWIAEIDSETEGIENYCINFIVYRTDGNSVTVTETIEDVPVLRLDQVIKALDKNCIDLDKNVFKLSLGTVYRLIPVKVNKEKKQVDIGRVLSIYKALLSGEKINHKILFNYACEALDKGLRQLSKSEIDNYFNMSLTRYANGYEDFFIRKLIYSYIILIRTCQDLGLLDREIFKSTKKEEGALNSFNTASEKVNLWISELESFLEKQGFDNDERALFYLGVLINRVALAQIEKKHKTKPILKKIQMQGMSQKEVERLSNDVVEKLIQYEKMSIFIEAVMNRFNYYYGSTKKTSKLNDHENVFYIMAGYAFLVGKKPLDITKEEEEAQKELLLDEENQE